MLDLDHGIILPTDMRIVDYIPSLKPDVIEYLVRTTAQEDIGKNIILNKIDLTDSKEYATRCAIKYDNVHFILYPVNRDLMKDIIRYDACKCLGWYLQTHRDIAISYFWNRFDGKSYLLWLEVAKIGSFADPAWIRIYTLRAKGGDLSAKEAITNVIKWMGTDRVIGNIYMMNLCAYTCIQIYGFDPFVRALLFNPSQSMDEFLQSASEQIRNGKEILQESVDSCLKDDEVMFATLRNIAEDNKGYIKASKVFSYILSHPDIRKGLIVFRIQ